MSAKYWVDGSKQSTKLPQRCLGLKGKTENKKIISKTLCVWGLGSKRNGVIEISGRDLL